MNVINNIKNPSEFDMTEINEFIELKVPQNLRDKFYLCVYQNFQKKLDFLKEKPK